MGMVFGLSAKQSYQVSVSCNCTQIACGLDPVAKGGMGS